MGKTNKERTDIQGNISNQNLSKIKGGREGKKSVSICYIIRIQEYEEREKKNPSKSQPVKHSVKVLEDDFGLSL